MPFIFLLYIQAAEMFPLYIYIGRSRTKLAKHKKKNYAGQVTAPQNKGACARRVCLHGRKHDTPPTDTLCFRRRKI